MIRAVLLDLDDTLLQLDTDAFSRRYLDAMGASLMRRFPAITPDQYQRTVRTAIGAVVANRDPGRTNAFVMNPAFSAGLAVPLPDLEEAVTAFYAEEYPGLRGVAGPMAGAAELVRALHRRGYQLVVATNPVFPPGPVRERLRWAGFPDAGSANGLFRLVTTMDVMHFCKPTPHYYEEILACIGVEAEDAIMVGDSLDNDIIPAKAAGLATFWVRPHDGASAGATGSGSADGAGTLGDLLRWVEEGWLHAIRPRPRTVEQVAPRMIGNVAALYGLTNGLSDGAWTTRPIADAWNPLELVVHLREAEVSTQRAQLQRIATEINPFLPPSAPPPGPGQRDLADRTGPGELAAFWEERQRTLRWLGDLSPADWERPARHSIFGPTNLLEMAHFTARHDRLHINQLCELIGSCAP